MSHTLQPGRMIGENRFFFSTNGDSFEELLRQARCTAPPSFIEVMRGSYEIPHYKIDRYRLVPIESEQPIFDLLSHKGHLTRFASTRELLRFLAEFPDRARRSSRIPMLGRDYITICHHGAIPTIRPAGDGFELYPEGRDLVMRPGDGVLFRSGEQAE